MLKIEDDDGEHKSSGNTCSNSGISANASAKVKINFGLLAYVCLATALLF